MNGKFALEKSQRQHAKAKRSLGNHSRQRTSNGHRKQCGKLECVTGKEKERHRETINESSVDYWVSAVVRRTAPGFSAACLQQKSVCVQAGGWKLPKSKFSYSGDWGSLDYSCFSSAKLQPFFQFIMERKPAGETVACAVRAGVNHVARYFPHVKNSNKCRGFSQKNKNRSRPASQNDFTCKVMYWESCRGWAGSGSEQGKACSRLRLALCSAKASSLQKKGSADIKGR